MGIAMVMGIVRVRILGRARIRVRIIGRVRIMLTVRLKGKRQDQRQSQTQR